MSGRDRPAVELRESKPLHVHTWACELVLNVHVAQTAQQIAAFVEPLLGMMAQLHDPETKAVIPPLPAFSEWMSFYENPAQFYVDVGNKASSSNLGTREMACYVEAVNAVKPFGLPIPLVMERRDELLTIGIEPLAVFATDEALLRLLTTSGLDRCLKRSSESLPTLRRTRC